MVAHRQACLTPSCGPTSPILSSSHSSDQSLPLAFMYQPEPCDGLALPAALLPWLKGGTLAHTREPLYFSWHLRFQQGLSTHWCGWWTSASSVRLQVAPVWGSTWLFLLYSLPQHRAWQWVCSECAISERIEQSPQFSRS